MNKYSPPSSDDDEDDFSFCPPPVTNHHSRQPVENDEQLSWFHENVRKAFLSQEDWQRVNLTQEEAIRNFRSVCEEPSPSEQLRPEVHQNILRRLATCIGQVVVGDSELVANIATYWKDCAAPHRSTTTNISRSTVCQMAVKSEGVILDCSLCLDLRQTYDVNDNYTRLTCPASSSFVGASESIKAVGAGQFGRVFQAIDNKTNQKFAEKIVTLGDFCKDEVEILSSIDHRHIVKLLGVIRTPAGVHLFMNYAGGGSVDQLLQEGEGFVGLTSDKNLFAEFWSVQYYKQVMSALYYLHGRRIVHCDVKASNVVLSSDKTHCFLADFGEACCVDANQQFVQVRSPSMLVGTEHSMSPEVVTVGKYYFLSDVWSAGCFLLHMLNGKTPWSIVCPSLDTYLLAIPKRPCGLLREVPDWSRSLTKSILSSSFAELHQRKSAMELLGLAEKNIRILASTNTPRPESPGYEVNVSIELTSIEPSSAQNLFTIPDPCMANTGCREDNVANEQLDGSATSLDGANNPLDDAGFLLDGGSNSCDHREELNELLDSIQISGHVTSSIQKPSSTHGSSRDYCSELDQLLNDVGMQPSNPHSDGLLTTPALNGILQEATTCTPVSCFLDFGARISSASHPESLADGHLEHDDDHPSRQDGT